MRVIAALLLSLCTVSVGQVSTPGPDKAAPQHKQLFHNNRITVNSLELAPGESIPMHRFDHDTLTVFVNGGHTRRTVSGEKPSSDKLEAGEVRFHSAGFTHSITNEGTEPLRTVVVEFADPQGKMKKLRGTAHTCNPDQKSCVEEKKLFCTAKVCVENVVMAPGSSSIRHSHATDHMLIAVSDYQISDEVEDKGTVMRKHKSGEVEFIPAGITHRLTNTGAAPARFTVILWK